ncbi:M50 family metallopeptidase [Candidatus Woesearchaeota archaeon]|nr:M50 family metallopeptidase [Candidatus Woesearchaeota archaeon]
MATKEYSMLLSFREIIDILIMTAAMGYIFKDVFRKEEYHGYDPLEALKHFRYTSGWQDFKFAALVTAPAIIFHELAHKFVALAYGLQATFHASYEFLGLGILLKLFNFPFIFFIPGYVSHSAAASHLHAALIAGAGPFMNLFFWFACRTILKNKPFIRRHKTWHNALFLSARINMFLFIFNMLPIPIFDGAQFYVNMFHAMFG